MNKELQEFTNLWIGREGIVAIAEGMHEGKKCIVVYLTNREDALRYGIPDVYKGVAILIRESPPIGSLPA
ncbi:MAG: hypothetical protein IPJ06_17440 [Saprospiraceae bacterium]|nr:hypothetical protein [Saprospiraceae bacterium]